MVLNIRVERVTRGVRMYQLAQALDLNPQTWAKFERGEKDIPAEVADRVAALFGRPAAELFSVVDAAPLVLAGAGRE